MALVAAAIANGGVIMQPHVVDRDPRRRRRASSAASTPKAWTTATDRRRPRQTVNEMMMLTSSRAGTGTAAQIPGITVAGKTGTAQTTPARIPHAWFIAFAPAEDPQVAVAVIVEHGGDFGQRGDGRPGRRADRAPRCIAAGARPRR